MRLHGACSNVLQAYSHFRLHGAWLHGLSTFTAITGSCLQNHLAGFVFKLACSMQISEKIVLSYRDGPEVVWPVSLLKEDGHGRKFVRLRASHPQTVKLVFGHSESFKEAKSPSLTASTKLKELQSMMHQKLKKALAKNAVEDDEFFQSHSKEEGKAPALKSLSLAPPTVTIGVGDVEVLLATPSTWKDKDLLVLLNEEQFTAVADYIQEDMSDCLGKLKKRKYERSGKFAKGKDAEDGQEEDDKQDCPGEG